MLNIFELAKEAYRRAQERRKNLRKFDAALIDKIEDGVDSTNEQVGEVGFGEEETTTTDERFDRSVILCGCINSGKSNLITRVMEQRAAELLTGTRTPTIALDYNYMHRTRMNMEEYAHIWELGNGGLMSNLLEITLNDDTWENSSVFLFLDLTRPEDFQSVVEPCLRTLRNRVNVLLNQLNILDSAAFEKRKSKLLKQFEEHPNRCAIKSFEIPLCVVAARYDEFQKLDNQRKRNTYKYLRALALLNGAMALTYSTRIDTLANRARALLYRYAFSGEGQFANAKTNVEPHEALFVAVGDDTLEAIGIENWTSGMRGDQGTGYTEAMSQWFYALNEDFPQTNLYGMSEENPSADKQFAEPRIDALIEEKTRALEAYKKAKRDREATEEKNASVEENRLEFF